MYISFPDWRKEVKKAIIDQDLSLPKVAELSGYCYSTIISLVSGRIAKSNYLEVAGRINDILGIKELPEKPPAPSEDWCIQVRMELLKRKMNIGQLSKETGFNRDRVSLVVNGHRLDEPVIKEINKVLGLSSGTTTSIAEGEAE